jgi:acyl-CoA dehydrogenase-like protein
MDTETRSLLVDTAGRMLRAGHGADLVEQIRDSGLAAEVWDDAAAWGALLEGEGGAAVATGLLDLVVLRGRHTDGVRLLLPEPGTTGPAATESGGRELDVHGVLLGTPGDATAVAVGLPGDGWAIVALRDLTASAELDAWDPGTGLVRVSGRAPGTPAPDATGWSAVLARCLARVLLGAGEAALRVAVRHAKDREQFGRAIASFQVVAHRLAESRVQLGAARALLDALDAEPGDALAWFAASLAKAAAGRAALGALATAQQVCGAMGFTDEFGLHRLVRRGYLVDSLLGGAEAAPWRIGSALAAGTRVPHDLVRL